MAVGTERKNVDPAEIARFDAAASRWWDPQGEMRPLHDLNPVRLEYVERAGKLQGRKVLDVGCGDGHFASVTFDQPLDVGIDPWAAPLRHALHLSPRPPDHEPHLAGGHPARGPPGL